jgi:tetratricopeptide (TPR) repeat protein
MKYYAALIAAIAVFLGTFNISSAEDNSSSQMVEIDEEIISQEVPAYKKSLKRLLKEAQNNLDEISKKIKTRENAELVESHIEKGNTLYSEGELEKAKEEWDKGLSLTKDPRIRKHIKELRKQTALKEHEL